MDQSSFSLGRHAIVIGGSMSGTLTARILSDYFEQVTIIERDEVSEDPLPRKGVPQGRHVHVMFSGGMRVVDRLFPGFSDELAANGAVVCDFANDLCWYQAGVWKARPLSGLTSYWQTRPFLESNLRRRLKQCENVRVLSDCTVLRLLTSDDRTRVNGLEFRRDDEQAEQLEADLVVDASGRGSQTPKWLEALGYQPPEETTVEVNIGYASRIYQPKPNAARDWQILAQYGTPPQSTRTGYIFPIEGGRWLASAVGFLKDHAPTDDEGYLDFARSMERPDFYDAIKDAEPLTPVSTFTFPANRWRRYDKLSRFPAGLLVIGDAISTFNPVYGQGMSTSALEVNELSAQLARCQGKLPDNFYQTFFRKTAKIIETPWLLATQADFLYPETLGKRSLRTKPLNWYLVNVLKLCNGSDRVTKTFYDVLHFNKTPTAFFHPSIIAQVILRTLGLKRSSPAAKQRPSLP